MFEPSRLIVGFESVELSGTALRWAIATAAERHNRLVVVHATAFPIRVQNGPSLSVARQLGSPAWAMVHHVVHGLGAPAATETIVESMRAIDAIERHARENDLIVLGVRRRPWWPFGNLERALEDRGHAVRRVSDSDTLVATDIVTETPELSSTLG